eukprot:gb/GEZN01007658.1/.p1 GENE.gb/GEZN01007658.1/~~gb/GEZN01007658.1/.p1  ORF type:complete len:478 (+),score=49.80 gb/GEZN01007658.1/:24-1436(+)
MSFAKLWDNRRTRRRLDVEFPNTDKTPLLPIQGGGSRQQNEEEGSEMLSLLPDFESTPPLRANLDKVTQVGIEDAHEDLMEPHRPTSPSNASVASSCPSPDCSCSVCCVRCAPTSATSSTHSSPSCVRLFISPQRVQYTPDHQVQSGIPATPLTPGGSDLRSLHEDLAAPHGRHSEKAQRPYEYMALEDMQQVPDVKTVEAKARRDSDVSCFGSSSPFRGMSPSKLFEGKLEAMRSQMLPFFFPVAKPSVVQEPRQPQEEMTNQSPRGKVGLTEWVSVKRPESLPSPLSTSTNMPQEPEEVATNRVVKAAVKLSQRIRNGLAEVLESAARRLTNNPFSSSEGEAELKSRGIPTGAGPPVPSSFSSAYSMCSMATTLSNHNSFPHSSTDDSMNASWDLMDSTSTWEYMDAAARVHLELDPGTILEPDPGILPDRGSDPKLGSGNSPEPQPHLSPVCTCQADDCLVAPADLP